jgi:hypothetical protein
MSTEVIKDLQVDITGVVLSGLCTKQSEFHASRVRFWEGHYAKVEANQIPPETEEESEDPVSTMLSNSYKAKVSFEDMKKHQLAQIRAKVQEHQNAQSELDFIAKYATPDGLYRIGNAEMRKLGVIK